MRSQTHAGPLFRAANNVNTGKVVQAHLPTRTLAAGLSTYTDLRIVAPSFVTVTSLPLLMLCRILSCESTEGRGMNHSECVLTAECGPLCAAGAADWGSMLPIRGAAVMCIAAAIKKKCQSGVGKQDSCITCKTCC